MGSDKRKNQTQTITPVQPKQPMSSWLADHQAHMQAEQDKWAQSVDLDLMIKELDQVLAARKANKKD